MNMAQNTQEKRTIKVRDFLDDFRSGIGDRELQEKYHLTQLGLEKFYGMLMDRGILSPQELQENYRGKDSEEKDTGEVITSESSFICPQCLASHQTMFDICPSCGVSFQEMISEQRILRDQMQEAEETGGEPKDETPVEQNVLDGIFMTRGPQDRDTQADSGLPDSEFCAPEQSDQPGLLPPTDAFAKFRGQFDDSSEEIVSGMPYGEASMAEYSSVEACCDGCKKVMEKTLRDVYDRTHSIKVLSAAGAFFLLGLVATVAIHFFSGYSFARLIVVYSTGLFLLLGSVLLAVGTFLFMAKEKVYCCPSCRRVYPRD
jgi:hypothetical protein